MQSRSAHLPVMVGVTVLNSFQFAIDIFVVIVVYFAAEC